MKIVFMEADTLGKDVDLSEFDKLGEVVKYLASEPAENAKRIEDADIIIVNKIPVNEELLKEAKNVKLVCVTATGTNIVDMPYVESRGIVVTNVKGYSTMSVAQHTFALLFYVYEKLAYYDRFVKSGTYAKSDVFSHFAKPFHELDGKVYGIIGMGRDWRKGGRDRGDIWLQSHLLFDFRKARPSEISTCDMGWISGAGGHCLDPCAAYTGDGKISGCRGIPENEEHSGASESRTRSDRRSKSIGRSIAKR